ncbi:hypothetical protein EK21DRAFT_91599 [Setomelanomma holmii]|uniref:Heterokaryon incompatibility domain-containing protein n=1 Tax=Setomelanomma holmii TaxID=210430 RepID=A0A9P4LJ77_9PLEO|nr:hypothetical protein EK21DRAFT_91599 [Setomelanomma holmii]
MDGFFTCKVRHALIDDRYFCLSYVWGEAEVGHWIMLNGQGFWIRDNLCAFLRYARQKLYIYGEWLWTDTLCIDQGSNAERTHQVQQMGRIFEGGHRLVSWLGSQETIPEHLERNSEYRNLISDEAYGLMYWDWAWITQKIGLARCNIYIVAGTETNRVVTNTSIGEFTGIHPFASVTLPTIEHSTPGWWLTPKFAHGSVCDSSRELFEEVTMDLKHLCSKSTGRVVFRNSLNFGVMYRYVSQKNSSQPPGTFYEAPE